MRMARKRNTKTKKMGHLADPRPGAKAGRYGHRHGPKDPRGGASTVQPFKPMGIGYDYKSAKAAGIKPDKSGHWASRNPETGLILKGRGHPTWSKTVAGEEKAGYEIYKKGKRYYSRKKK